MSNPEERHPPIKDSPKKRMYLRHFKWLGESWDDAENYKRCFGATFRVLEQGCTYDELEAVTSNAHAHYFLRLVETTWKSPNDIRFPLKKEERQSLRLAFYSHLKATGERFKTRKEQFELLQKEPEEPQLAPEYLAAMAELKRAAPYWASEKVARRLALCIGTVFYTEPTRLELDDLRKALGCNAGRDFLNYLLKRTDTYGRQIDKLPEEYQTDWDNYMGRWYYERLKPEDFELDKGHPGGGTPLEDQRAMVLEALKCSDALWTMASGEEAAHTLVKEAISLGVGKEELLSHVESAVGQRFIEKCFSEGATY